MERILYQDTHNIVSVEVEPSEEVRLTHVWFPMAGYGNNVTTEISVNPTSGEVEAWKTRQSWNGTGSEPIARLVLEPNDAKKLADRISQIQTPEDVEKVVTELEDIEEKHAQVWTEAINSLVDELSVLTPNLKREIESLTQEAKQRLLEHIAECISDWLAPS